jgi:Zn-dependent peptidase ImmA (M78 family)/transcriptional regulator with XRE-family HTH domain
MTASRVRQVRELLGWTQTELAELAGLDQPTISAVEAGAAITTARVRVIAQATGFPEAWFMRPMTIEEFPEGTIRYRKSSKASKKDDRRAVRRLEVAAELVNRLAEGVRTPPVTLETLDDSAAADIEGSAQHVRALLGLSDRGPIRNLLRAIERAGVVIVGLPVEFGPSDRVQNHHGASAWPDPMARPVIGFSTVDPGDRQRHTLGHELGHLVLHRAPVEERDLEGEASRFAGALLMPIVDAVEAFERVGVNLRALLRLKEEWGVSIAGLAMRAAQVGAIDRDRLESLFKQISARGWRRDEPVTVHRETPALLQRLLEVRYGGPIDWIGVGKAEDLPPHLLRELACVGQRDRAPSTARVVSIGDLASRRSGVL